LDAFRQSTAFSPADTVAVARQATAVILAQAGISLVILAMLAAYALTIIRSGAAPEGRRSPRPLLDPRLGARPAQHGDQTGRGGRLRSAIGAPAPWGNRHNDKRNRTTPPRTRRRSGGGALEVGMPRRRG
jgi:hypothetical protein